MSVDVYLRDSDGNTLSVEAHTEGGTYAVGGLPEAHLNITYNYSKLYALAFPNYDGMISLFTGKVADKLELFKKAVERLGTVRYEDYWAPTPGNAGHALSVLVKWMEQHPDAIMEASG